MKGGLAILISDETDLKPKALLQIEMITTLWIKVKFPRKIKLF